MCVCVCVLYVRFSWSGESIVADSNLQTFPPSDTRGKISGVSGPPSDVDGMCIFKTNMIKNIVVYVMNK